MPRLQIWHLVLLIVAFVVLFGWKNLPNIARSMGESMRVFKTEVDQMKDENAARKDRDGAAAPPLPEGEDHRADDRYRDDLDRDLHDRDVRDRDPRDDRYRDDRYSDARDRDDRYRDDRFRDELRERDVRDDRRGDDPRL